MSARIVVVAAAYKYGTYVTEDALAVLARHGTVARIDARALPVADRLAAFAAVAADAAAVVVAPWGGQGLEAVPDWLGAAPKARVVAGTFDFRFHRISTHDRPVTVIDTSRTLTPTVAEFSLAMILNLLRDIPAHVDLMRRGGWTQRWSDQDGFVAGDLAGRAVGLAGFGVLNRSLATLLRPFGCAVTAYDPYVPADEITAAGVTPCPDLVSLAERSDVFVVGIPHLPDTEGVVDRAVIDALPRGALFVLPTRMAVVAQDALWARVDAGHLRVAVDVFEPEPPPGDAWLRIHPHVLATPHLAGNTAQGHRRCFRVACEETVAALRGLPVRHAMSATDALIYSGSRS